MAGLACRSFQGPGHFQAPQSWVGRSQSREMLRQRRETGDEKRRKERETTGGWWEREGETERKGGDEVEGRASLLNLDEESWDCSIRRRAVGSGVFCQSSSQPPIHEYST